MTYLGHKLSEKGVQPNENKIVCVKNVPTPKNQTDIKKFSWTNGILQKVYLRLCKNSKTTNDPTEEKYTFYLGRCLSKFV